MANLQRVMALLILAVVLSLSKTALGDTYYVPDHFAGIQEAIDSPGMVAGDTIIVRDGVYYENISFTEQPLTVRSENGAATTIINGGGSGAVAYFEYDAVLEGFTITNGGRGIDCYHASPTIVNCVITGNTNTGYGAGIGYYGYCYPTVTNCTISGNHADDGGAAIYAPCIGLITTKNSILWGNTPNEIYMGGMGDTTVSISHSDVTGGWSGTGNINADPLFVDPVAGDFHIQAASPCVDAGTNSPPELPDIDFEGDTRVNDGDGDGTAIIDMGADEFFDPTVRVEFSAEPTSGAKPLIVQFTDQSTGSIDTWEWDFDNDTIIDSTAQSPAPWTYTEAGDYTVSLTATGPGGSDTETKVDYINVREPDPPLADFTADVTSGFAPLTVQFTDQSTGTVEGWMWDFGASPRYSWDQNPSHTYTSAGDFTVKLTSFGPDGQDIEVKENYIHVTEPSPIIDKLKYRRREPGQKFNIVGSNFGWGNPGDYVRIGRKELPFDHIRIKEWTPTNIQVKIPKQKYVRNGCAWFKGLNERKVKIWVNIGGVDSNKKKLTLIKNPADCR